MKSIVLLLFVGFLFLGCSVSSIHLSKDEKLTLKYKEGEILLGTKVESSEFLNYKDLFVEQYRLKDEKGRELFYENAYTALNFEFNYSALSTVMYIFNDSREYEEVYRSNNLRLVQLLLKDKKYINVVIKSSDTQVISYVYGFSNEEFLELASQLKSDKLEVIKLKYRAKWELEEPLTNWNSKLVFFTPLITPLRTMGRL